MSQKEIKGKEKYPCFFVDEPFATEFLEGHVTVIYSREKPRFRYYVLVCREYIEAEKGGPYRSYHDLPLFDPFFYTNWGRAFALIRVEYYFKAGMADQPVVYRYCEDQDFEKLYVWRIKMCIRIQRVKWHKKSIQSNMLFRWAKPISIPDEGISYDEL